MFVTAAQFDPAMTQGMVYAYRAVCPKTGRVWSLCKTDGQLGAAWRYDPIEPLYTQYDPADLPVWPG